MKFTQETLRLKCEEFKIRGNSQEKLIKEFFETYPSIELKEEEYNYERGRGVDYFSKDSSLILKFEDNLPSGETNHGSARLIGSVYFHGKDSSHVMSEDGYDKVIPHKVIDNHKSWEQWYERIKDIFLHTR